MYKLHADFLYNHSFSGFQFPLLLKLTVVEFLEQNAKHFGRSGVSGLANYTLNLPLFLEVERYKEIVSMFLKW